MPFTPEELDEGTPVFLINGFLEAGKSQFLNFTITQDYFQTEGRTLLILCEDGEVEYPADVLKKTNTIMVKVLNEGELTPEKLRAMNAAYNPERIIIEWNGIWPQDDLKLPDGMFYNQVITIVDTSTLDLYLKNMKPLLGQMLRRSELVICNRADNIPESTLANYKMSLKAMARDAEIIFEGAEGEIRGDFSIDFPYDINADHLVIGDKDFGIFFVDSMDRPERYAGKTIEFTAEVLKPKELAKDEFVAGRMIMTCCEADIQFLGLISKYKGADVFKDGDWIKFKGIIKAEEREEYGTLGPVLYATDIARTGKLEGVLSF